MLSGPLERTCGEDEDWLARFHAGAPEVMEACYLEHFDTVNAAVGRVLSGADRETVVHELFLRLLSNQKLREAFRGGHLGAWLTTLARNQAIDFLRRRRFEQSLPDSGDRVTATWEESVEARLLVERFKRECLPPKWAPVFQARFLDRLDQGEAARALGVPRTTLAYQEHRVRRLLRRFLVGGKT